MKKHSKHPETVRQNMGLWGRNELSFVGTDCGRIKEFCTDISDYFADTHNSIYIDASHSEVQSEKSSHAEIIEEAGRFTHLSLTLSNKISRNIHLNPYDLILINGNHHPAEAQVIFLQKEKENSLRKRMNQLNNIKLFISVDGTAPWDFLREDNSECPIFNFNERGNILTFLKKMLISKIPPLKGLVLAGGKSSRMGQDKGGIVYHKVQQREYLKKMLEQNQLKTFISCRAEQVEELGGSNLIVDQFSNAGPMGAILSAMKSDPNAAWLVVAVDMPDITNIEIEHLMSERSPGHFATCFHNDITDFPEPLFTIFEPKAYMAMLETFALGYVCPRKFLITHDIKSIKTKDQKFLKNINTPEERQNWKRGF